MDPELFVGQTLYARNGDKITVAEISGRVLTLQYQSRQYARTAEDIGKSLFLSNPLEQSAAEVYEGDVAFEQETTQLKETQERLATFQGFVLAIDIGLFSQVVGTQIGFDEVTKDELIRAPYFARLDIIVDDARKTTLEIAYIGKKGVYHENRFLISDWRSEIGQKYYLKNITRFDYNSFEYELQLRRALRIRNGSLTGYENEYAKAAYLGAGLADTSDGEIRSDRITDPFLQDIIRQKHTQNKLTDIIESIQENQNTIITHDENDSIVVQGCAGSGKTMILLHRLSFIKYRNRNMDLSRIKILTPNALFSMYINDLSTSLELEKIDRLTVTEYYAELLSRYYGLERLQLKNKCAPGELLDYKAALLMGDKPALSWPGVYTEDVRAFIGVETARVLQDIFEKDIQIGRLGAVLKSSTSRGPDSAFDIRYIASLAAVLANIRASFAAYDERLALTRASEASLAAAEQEFLKKKAAVTNADALLDRLAQEARSGKPNLRLGYEQQKRDLSQKLRQLETELKRQPDGPRRRTSRERMVSVSNALWECDFCIAALQLERAKHVLEIDRKHLREERDRLPYSDGDMALIESAYAKTRDFSVAGIEKTVLDAVKLEYGNLLSFRNMIYVRLLTRYFLYGPLTNPETLLCIDEAHDLSAGEYRLFADVCDRPRFNIYGDINQLVTSGDGISDWDILRDIFGFTQFTLNENYRNSAEIVDYCNDTLGFQTTNLGVGGEPVRTLDFDSFVRHMNNSIMGTRKICIIAKKKTPALLSRLREALTDKIDPRGLTPGEIAVLTPPEAKGLEFDTCYVLTKGMNRNEMYISYTRALNELYIVPQQ